MRLQENHELIGDTPDGNFGDFGRYYFSAPLSDLLELVHPNSDLWIYHSEHRAEPSSPQTASRDE